MKLTSLLFLAALPVTLIVVLAGAPALPTLAFTAPVLLLAMASDDYNPRSRRFELKRAAVRPARARRLRARLRLAA